MERDFTAHKIAAQVVNEFEEVVKEEHMYQRGVFTEWENEDGQKIKGIGVFPKFKNNPGRQWRPMPKLGEDTRYLLERAGFSEEKINEFKESGKLKFAE